MISTLVQLQRLFGRTVLSVDIKRRVKPLALFALAGSLSVSVHAQIGSGWTPATENYTIQTSAGCTAVPLTSGVGGVFNVPGPGIYRSEFRFEGDLPGQGISSGTEQFQGDVTLNSFGGNRVTVKQTFEENIGSWSLIAVDKNIGGFYDVHASPQVLLAPFTVGQTARINTILTFSGQVPIVNVYINGAWVEQLFGDGNSTAYDKVGAYVSSSGTGPAMTTWQNILFWTGGSSNNGTPVAMDSPGFSPAAGTYATAQSVTLSSTTSGASIAYTTDGSTPTEVGGAVTHGVLLSNGGSIFIGASTTIKAIAFGSGQTDSPLVTAAYAIQATAPAFSPAIGTYTSAQSVALNSISGASFAYTTDGSTPTEVGGTVTHGTLYSGAIPVGSTTTLSAIAFESGYADSPVVSGVYNINIAGVVSAPTFSPPAGTYTSAQSVTLSSATSGASFAYTTDGSTPTESGGAVTHGILYSGAFPLGATTSLKAIAFASGLTDSAVAAAAYAINIPPQAATPTFSPGSGTYTSVQSVAINSTTSGASFAYTTDGTTPSESGGFVTNGILYSGPVSIGATATLKAIAFESGLVDSAVGSAAYTLNLPQVIMPTFSPAAGIYNNAQSVTIGSTTSGASFAYTTDGSTPTEVGGTVTHGILYSGPVSVGANTTLEAIAFENGLSDSAVATAIYTIGTQVPLLNDLFTSGVTGFFLGSSSHNPGIGVQDPPYSADWIGNGANGTSSGESYTNNGNGTGNILFPTSSSTENVTAFFETPGSYYTIGAGNSLTLQFNFTVSGPVNNNAGIRFGLFNSGSTGSTSNQITRETGGGYTAGLAGSPAAFSGYYASFDPASATNTSGVVSFFNRAPSTANSTFISSTTTGAYNQLGYGAIPITSPGLTGVTNGNPDTYHATLILSYAANGSSMNLSFGITDVTNPAGTLYSYSVIDTGAAGTNTSNSFANPIVTSFDGLSIGELSNQGTLTLTNVTVAYITGQPPATPTFNPAGGVYATSPSVTISTATSGASIAYTTDGSTPASDGNGNIVHGALYSGAFSLSESTTLTAIAFENGHIDSAMASSIYTISLPPAIAPTFSPVPGTYTNAQTVTISTVTSGASIRYTTDGSTPTEANGTLYSGLISVNHSTVLKAIAYGNGFGNSAVASGLYTTTISPAVSLNVLYNFTGSPDGGRPEGVFIQGSDGNFYGTTESGGSNGDGTVFKLTPAGVLATLASFTGANGQWPVAGLTQGSDGNFYGTTSEGGSANDGTVFKLTPAGVLTTLVSFYGGNGQYPYAGLVQGSDGNFYGTTYYGGSSGEGTVFKMTPAGTLTTLDSFNYYNNNGAYLEAGLVKGSDGNFYGTTEEGGSGYEGTVFKMTPAGTLTALASFNGADGAYPNGLIQGSDGNFYGTTSDGGSSDDGTVFKLTPAGVLTILVSFTGANGEYPGDLIQGSDGNFYGTAGSVVFKMTPAGVLTTLVSFVGANGEYPGDLIQGSDGSFYGTTYEGGSSGYGVVFQLIVPPQVSGPTFSPAAGTYTSVQSVAITSTTPGALIAYTTDGSTPTEVGDTVTHGTLLSNGGSISIGASTNLNAIAFEGGYIDSPVDSAAYIINLPKVATPTFSPPADTYTSRQSVAISTTTTGAIIRYTTDGSTPTKTYGTVYSSAVTVGANMTLNAIAYETGYTDSAVASAVYTINIPPAATPTFSPVAGTYTSVQSVVISTTTSGTTIRYTTDGITTPTETVGAIYSGPIPVSANTTLNAIAYETGYTDSLIATATYTINLPQVAMPTFSPVAGSYTGPQSVAISSNTSGASIAYTTNGTTPAESGGSVTNGALLSNGGSVSVSASTTLNAMAFASGFTDSAVGTAAYTISVPIPTMPRIQGSSGYRQTQP